MKFRVLKLLIMLFLITFLMAFSIVRNGDREIDFSNINYLDSKFIALFVILFSFSVKCS